MRINPGVPVRLLTYVKTRRQEEDRKGAREDTGSGSRRGRIKCFPGSQVKETLQSMSGLVQCSWWWKVLCRLLGEESNH